jgi:uncharacterized protein (DUF433 family)
MATIAAAGALVVGGAGVAVATTGGDDAKQREDAVLSDAAKRLDVQPSELRDALAAAEDAQLDADVRAGRLTQDQADAVKRERAEHGTVLGGGSGPRFGPHGPGIGFGPGPGGPGDVIGAAASALGLTQAELFEQLRSGKSIAAIAEDQGKSLDDVRATVRAAVGKKLDKAVADGDLTRAEADAMLARIADHLDELGDFGGPHFDHHGPGGPFGGRSADVFGAAAGALGITPGRLIQELRGGKTPAEVAKAHGKSLDAVRAAVRAAVRKHLDDEVAEGHITKTEAAAMLDRLTEHLDDFGRFGHPPGP